MIHITESDERQLRDIAAQADDKYPEFRVLARVLLAILRADEDDKGSATSGWRDASDLPALGETVLLLLRDGGERIVITGLRHVDRRLKNGWEWKSTSGNYLNSVLMWHALPEMPKKLRP